MIPDSYYATIWTPNFWLPKQIAMRESSENPLAVGDVGLAVGLFQMHYDFIQTWAPMPKAAIVVLPCDAIVIHWSAGIWALALHNFLDHHSALDISIAKALRIFHYGHDEQADPDDYVADVLMQRPKPALTWSTQLA